MWCKAKRAKVGWECCSELVPIAASPNSYWWSNKESPGRPSRLLFLKLREIVELICAPKIHANQVAYLNILIREYLDSRVSLFPDKSAKPKHHYLLHYPDLILKFGPLIRLWTLRFESKHTYFKQCARKLRNFKSLGSTLAERHQLLQTYLHSGNIFAPVLQIDQANAFHSQIYNAAIQQAVTCRG